MKSNTKTKPGITKSSVKKPRVVKNNSAFRRAMVQMEIQPGEKVTVIYDDGSSYQVEGV
jgi:hypothetical protein